MDSLSWADKSQIVAIISTTRKESLLQISLPSIFKQDRKPDLIYVVADSMSNLPKDQISKLNAEKIQLKCILNMREQNLSGAINTVLSEMLLDGFDPDRTFISILDDDDWWEPDYLSSCIAAASKNGSDWIVSGIVRHENTTGSGILLSIPDRLDEKSFLRGNPHVQGSNLFVRFSDILLAGGFDENLPSTTDRDLCLRLLFLREVKITIVRRHLVHHIACSPGRLSEPGSEKKCLGLARFYHKYRFFMEPVDANAFLDRARLNFGCDPLRVLQQPKDKSVMEQLPHSSERNYSLVIGAIVSDTDSLDNVLLGTISLKRSTGSVVALVISDNAGLTEYMEKAGIRLASEGIKLKIVSPGEAQIAADKGDLGQYYVDEKNRTGIAFGRTVLQRYVYLMCLNYPDPVAWIIDDDISLKSIYWGKLDRVVSGNELSGLINKWKREGVSIAIGKVGGDPPVPIMSTSRTQMLDLFFNAKAMLFRAIHSNVDKRPGDNSDIINNSPAYFYDFPEDSFRHLETPVWNNLEESAHEDNSWFSMLSSDPKILLRKEVFRPAIYPMQGGSCGDKYFSQYSEEFGPVRGGNTIILDIERLRDFNNSAPRSSDLGFRRGDTLWTVLNKRLGSRRPLRKADIIVSTSLMLTQSRIGDETLDEMRQKLIADTLGSAFVRSIDMLLLDKKKRDPCYEDYYDPLNFSDSDAAGLLSSMDRQIDRRVRQIFLNSWRIRGLSKSIRNTLEEFSHYSCGGDYHLKPVLNGIADICNLMETLFGRKEIDDLVERIKRFNREELAVFTRQLAPSCRQFGDALPIHYEEAEIEKVKEVIKSSCGSGELINVGSGKEGLVFTDGVHAYKYFHYGRFGLDSKSRKFLDEKIIGRKFSGLVSLKKIISAGDNLILQEEYLPGETYHGGNLNDLVSLLKECKSGGIVIKNVAPKNLIYSDKGLKFVDLGRDLEPFTERGFERMCRRAYLTYRWHFREDLHELLSRSNQETSFPELFGFEYFLDLLYDRDTSEISVPFTTGIIKNSLYNRILDYGCGKGQISDELEIGFDVSVYDKDISDYRNKHKNGSIAKVLDRENLDRISQDLEKFDLVLVSLVLCTVDDIEAREILADARRLVRNGGELMVVICNPFNLHNRKTNTHEKIGVLDDYHHGFTYEKKMSSTGRIRLEYHRPVGWYIDEMKKAGFQPYDFSESDGTSFDTVSPGSDFLMIRALASETPKVYDVSLMIKASPMEWKSIGFQVRHIVKQLEGPEKFKEKFIVTDRTSSNFARQYDIADVYLFQKELQGLLDQRVVDYVLYSPEENEANISLSKRWFGVECTQPKSSNGQPTLTTLCGLEHASSKYILQLDSDCIISRDGTGKSYLSEMVNVLDSDSDAVTVSFPVCNEVKVPFTPVNEGDKWRTEVRNCLIHRPRLFSLRPLPNSLGTDGKLTLTWHRSLDKKLASGPWKSYRGSLGNAYFTHIPNSMKTDLNFWYNVICEYEKSPRLGKQVGEVNLQIREIHELLDTRNEEVVVIVKGRNIPIPKIRRCFRSLINQDFQRFGVIYVDAASENGADEYVQYIGRKLFKDKLTIFRNYTPLTSMENIYISIKEICGNPKSIIVMVDADDALIGSDALSRVMHRYREGADLTVGTMLRTDKYKEYPVDFKEPRIRRGGNVWQHLRTFRKYLFDSIDPEDLKIEGKWIEKADDWAYMIPMVEMAQRPEVILDYLYFYEPSPEKKERQVEGYENIIAKILEKRPYDKAVIQ